MLDARQLNIFLVAAELENFSEAARHLNLSQPSVSAQIQSLERRLETELFSRSGRHVSLTEQGQALLPLAREMVHLSMHIEETINSLTGTTVGHLRIGCSTTSGKYVIPRLVARFLAQHPHVQFTCDELTHHAVVDGLLEGAFHLAVTSTQEFVKEIAYHRLTTVPIILIVPADHPWASQQQITPQDLFVEKFILREPRAGTRRALEEGLASHNIHVDQLPQVMVLPNDEAIRTAVEEKIGVAFISRLVAAASIQLGRIAEVKVSDCSPQQNLYIGYGTRRPATKAQTCFLDFIQAPTTAPLLG